MFHKPSPMPPEATPSRVGQALDDREGRVRSARGLLRDVVGLLSAQVNDEEAIGGALDGLRDAEAATRSAMRCLHGLDTSRDVRRSS